MWKRVGCLLHRWFTAVFCTGMLTAWAGLPSTEIASVTGLSCGPAMARQTGAHHVIRVVLTRLTGGFWIGPTFSRNPKKLAVQTRSAGPTNTHWEATTMP